MKKFIILIIAALPIAVFAGNGDKGNSAKIDINILTDKNGKVEINVQNDKDFKALEKEIDSALNQMNKALKNVHIVIGDGKNKHEVHLKADIKFD